MKKFKISKKCNACGMCMEMTNLIVGDEKGYARPKDGCFIDEKCNTEEIIKICPVGAISVEECGSTSKQGKEALQDIRNALSKRLKEVERPNAKKDDVKFDAHAYSAEVGDYQNSSSYEYSSESAAERAGLREFDRGAYSQYRKIILSIFVQYKNDKLKPYYTLDETGFYAKNNKKYEKILSEIAAEAKSVTNNEIILPADFTSFDVFPGDAYNGVSRKDCVTPLSCFENRSTSSGIMAEFNSNSYSSLDSYTTYFDTDDMETYQGEGWLGSKYTYKYRFYNVYAAVNEYVKDLKNAMNYVNIDDGAVYELEQCFKAYNAAIDAAIEKKISIFEESVSKVN